MNIQPEFVKDLLQCKGQEIRIALFLALKAKSKIYKGGPSDIGSDLGISKQAAWNGLNELVAKGIVEKRSRGEYFVTC